MKKLLLTSCLLLASQLSIVAYTQGNWVQEEAGWAYYNHENLRLNGWFQDQYQCWYLLDYDSGIMKTGWVAENSDWYYLNPDNGIMQSERWIDENGSLYYLLANGKMAIGNVEIEGVTYAFAPNGVFLYEVEDTLPLPPNDPINEIGSNERELAQQVIYQVNEVRKDAGLEALKEASEKLTKAADLRVNELTVHFSHERPDGSYFATILDEVSIHTYYYAENIAFEYRTVEEAMDFWLNSETHRANLLNPKFNEIAVSVIPSQTGYLWEMICIGE